MMRWRRQGNKVCVASAQKCERTLREIVCVATCCSKLPFDLFFNAELRFIQASELKVHLLANKTINAMKVWQSVKESKLCTSYHRLEITVKRPLAQLSSSQVPTNIKYGLKIQEEGQGHGLQQQV
jgi:hypothetical protein